MRRIGLVVVTTLAFTIGGVVAAGPALAATACTGTLSGTVAGNVEVPPGAVCTLDGATVTGNVLVDPGGWLSTGGGANIGGSLVATQPVNVLLLFSNVTNNVSITGLTGGDCASGLGFTTIGGSLNYSHSASGAGFFEIGGGPCGGSDAGNTIRGAVNLQGNGGAVLLNGAGPGGSNTIRASVIASGNAGGGFINYNTIGGTLSCQANSPALSVTGNSAGRAVGC